MEVTHKSPWAGWYATQESSTSVTFYSKQTEEKLIVERPKRWGRNWSWNISPDGSGIVMHRTGLTVVLSERSTTNPQPSESSDE